MKDLILNYQSIIGTVIGAFLAALFGYFTQKCLEWARNINEANKVLLLVKEEMQLNFELAKSMAITKEGVYEFQVNCYEKFLDKILLIKNEDVRCLILRTYHILKLYNSGINSNYVGIMDNIRALNDKANWGLHLEDKNEIDRMIFIYHSEKIKGNIIEAKLANYEGKERRGIYGIVCSLDRIEKAIRNKV
jgi:hypothetical protein